MRLRQVALALALPGLSACWWWDPVPVGPAHPEMAAIEAKGDALAISDALEALIAEGKDSRADREGALAAIQSHPENSAQYAFARAAVTGRVVQVKGPFAAAGLVHEVEYWAEVSRKLNPSFREGAATRMLGTLCVMAPSSLLEHCNQETGFELLEGLQRAHPETPENNLRLGEAYLTAGDKESAVTYLCFALAKKAALRHDDQTLLEHLLSDAGNPTCPQAPQPPQR